MYKRGLCKNDYSETYKTCGSFEYLKLIENIDRAVEYRGETDPEEIRAQ